MPGETGTRRRALLGRISELAAVAIAGCSGGRNETPTDRDTIGDGPLEASGAESADATTVETAQTELATREVETTAGDIFEELGGAETETLSEDRAPTISTPDGDTLDTDETPGPIGTQHPFAEVALLEAARRGWDVKMSMLLR
jgi:hypothetical protein